MTASASTSGPAVSVTANSSLAAPGKVIDKLLAQAKQGGKPL
jgi:hypothetical protein